MGYFSSSPHAGDPLLNWEGMISTLGGSDGYEEAEPQKSHCESDPRWDMTSPSAPGVPAGVWRQGWLGTVRQGRNPVRSALPLTSP